LPSPAVEEAEQPGHRPSLQQHEWQVGGLCCANHSPSEQLQHGCDLVEQPPTMA